MRSFILHSLLLLAGILTLNAAHAQRLDQYKARLAEPVLSTQGETTGNMARVTVREIGSAADAVARWERMARKTHFQGYRVCIFFDNGQNARQQANAAVDLFKEQFSEEIPVYMVYENPYFKVTIGNCLTKEESIILMGRVLGTFPKAFSKKEVLSVSDLLR